MLIWDDAIVLAKWLATDDDTETENMAKMLMNLSYKQVLARFKRDQNSDTQFVSTVANQRSYMLPPNYSSLISVNYNYGGLLSPVELIQDENLWDQFTAYERTTDRPARCFIKTRFGVFGNELLLDPIPSTVGTLTVKFEATDRDLSRSKHTTGDVTITPGSTVITGNAAIFTNAMVGRYFNVTSEAGTDGYWYRISSFTSANQIDLETVYDGNGSGVLATQSYQIAEAFGLPEEMQILPVYSFLHHFWSKMGNKDKTAEFLGLYNGIMNQAKSDYSSKDGNAKIFNTSKYNAGNFPVYPGHFPQHISGS